MWGARAIAQIDEAFAYPRLLEHRLSTEPGADLGNHVIRLLTKPPIVGQEAILHHPLERRRPCCYPAVVTVPKKSVSAWKKGRGKLGVLDPLLGSWETTTESKLGRVRCTRTLARVLNGTWVQLDACWEMPGKRYEERALFGVDSEAGIIFHSFTSDGKRSQGKVTDGRDVHAEAIAFVAEMPAGQARMIYWPGDNGTMNWAVESRAKKGWSRFAHHVYTRT